MYMFSYLKSNVFSFAFFQSKPSDDFLICEGGVFKIKQGVKLLFKGDISMKISLFQCLCTYIWVSGVPTNPQTVVIRQPSQFFVGLPIDQKVCDSKCHSDLAPLPMSHAGSLEYIAHGYHLC